MIKSGDKFSFPYKGQKRHWKVITPSRDNRWKCSIIDGEFQGFIASFSEDQLIRIFDVQRLVQKVVGSYR